MIGVKVRFRAVGRWEPVDVAVRWVPGNRPRIAEIEDVIERTWRSAQGRPGLKLFDGPMCRLQRLSAGSMLELELSRTSYKIFWGTNLNNAGLADIHGVAALANPLGLSCALESADGFLLLGRRNSSVAYYPSRVHPFAGAVEPAEEMDLFAEARRELVEELGPGGAEITGMFCLGLIEDVSIHQPELVFSVKSSRSRAQIKSDLDPGEHDSIVAIEPEMPKVEFWLKDSSMTPVALGTLLLWGRDHFGPDWFDAAARAVNLGES